MTSEIKTKIYSFINFYNGMNRLKFKSAFKNQKHAFNNPKKYTFPICNTLPFCEPGDKLRVTVNLQFNAIRFKN